MGDGQLGGIIGGVLGLAGGVIGTYFSIRNTNGPLERTFMVKVVVIGWILITVFIGLLLVLPPPYNYLMWIPYGILLPISIIKCNKRQNEIRNQECDT